MILVIGGYDVANLPEIGYGHYRPDIKRWVSRATIRRATALTTFSKSSQKEAATNLELPADRITMIYLGVPDPFADRGPVEKERVALTVGNVDRENLLRKGLRDFVDAASYLPDATFWMAGNWRDDAIDALRARATKNVTFTGELDTPRLVELYRRASIYVQASRHEGFGLAAAEGMLGQCIPVVSTAGSLPEVVGEAGVYLKSLEPKAIADDIRRAFALDGWLRSQARERILVEFPVEKRRRALFDLVEAHL
jgi:glycosyltransferase involved in cell wall biosynthesis